MNNIGGNMEVNYIYGNNKTSKTKSIVEIAKDFQQKGEKTVVIVPEQINLTTEMFLLDELQSILNVQVYSFQRLSNKVFGESGIRNLINLEETGKIMLLKLILNRNEKRFLYYKRSSFKSGFANELSEFLSEFYKNDITQEELDNLINNEDVKEIVRLKLHDIKIILEEYNNYLSEKFISSDETLDLLANKMSDSTYLKDINVIIDGFYGLSEQEYKVVRNLLKMAKSFTITFNVNIKRETDYFTSLNKFDPYFETKKMVNKITDIIKEENLNVSKISLISEDLDINRDLDFLKYNFFMYKNVSKFEGEVENIELLSSRNKIEECDNIAKKIVQLSNSGYAFNEMKVICSDVSEYKTLLQGVFLQYDIPFFIDEKDSIVTNSLVEFIINSIDVFVSNFSFEKVMNLLKIDLFYEDSFEEFEIEIFENYLLEYGIKGYQFANEFTYGKNNKRYDLEKINLTRSKVIEKLSPFTKDITSSKKYETTELCKRLYDLLMSNNTIEKIDNIIEKSVESNNLKRKQEYEQIWDKIINLIDKIVDVFGSEMVTVKQFGELVKEGLESTTLGMIPMSQDEVTVGDYSRSKFRKSKVVFVMGAKDDSYPVKPKENSVITDVERQGLKKYSEKITTVSDIFLKQNLLIYDILVTASEKLIISFPVFTLNSNQNTEALFIKKIKDMFPNISYNSTNEIIITNKRTMFPLIIDIIKKQKIGIDVTENELEFLRTYEEDGSYCHDIEIIKNVIDGYKPNQILSQNSIYSIYENKMQTSVSKLESYAKCPFAYFLQYNLRLKDRKMFEVLHVDIGTVFHAILDEFNKTIDDLGIKFQEVTEAQISEIVEDVVENLDKNEFLLIFNNSYRYSYYLERIKEIAKSSIGALSIHLREGDFSIFKSEFEFGQDKISKIVINIDDEKEIELTGKVDRIDILEDGENRYVKVLDYKTSHKKFNEDDVVLGTQLQLLTYLDILIKKGNEIFGGNKEFKYLPGGIYYFEIKSPKVNEVMEKNSEVIKQKILSEFKLEGVTNSSDKLYTKVDNNLENGSSSDIIKVRVKKDGDLYSDSSVYTNEQFDEIRAKVNEKIVEISKNIFDGKIDIDYDKSENLKACKYCNFSGVCKRDLSVKE